MHDPEFHPGWIKIAMKNITMRTDEILIWTTHKKYSINITFPNFDICNMILYDSSLFLEHTNWVFVGKGT